MPLSTTSDRKSDYIQQYLLDLLENLSTSDALRVSGFQHLLFVEG